jgi:hypothetical protein
MHARLKFAAWLGALHGGVLALIAATMVLVEAGMPEQDQAVLSHMLEERAPLLGFVAGLLLACGGLVAWLFKRHVGAPRALAEQTRLVLANPGYRVEAAESPELSALAAEINRLAGARTRHRRPDPSTSSCTACARSSTWRGSMRWRSASRRPAPQSVCARRPATCTWRRWRWRRSSTLFSSSRNCG